MGGFGGDGRSMKEESDDPAAGPAMDCSGRGICDYSNGICQCFKGTKFFPYAAFVCLFHYLLVYWTTQGISVRGVSNRLISCK